MALPILRLQPQRHRRIAHGHPWVYSNELVMDGAAKSLPPGTIVRFLAHDGSFLGTGTFNPRTLIAGRIMTRRPIETLDKDWLLGRIREAMTLRDRLIGVPYYRLIHAEADGIPGLIVDRYGPHLSLEINTAGAELLLPEILAALDEALAPASVILHRDASFRTMEGLSVVPAECVKGALSGPQEVLENGLSYRADLVCGQKTGWYYDQRDNHKMIASLAKGQRVLDLFCHAGGFGLLAAKAGAASVVGVDASNSALELAALAQAAGKIENCTWHRSDVFDDLEARISAKEKFDIVIADPPPFVKSRKDLASGARGYRKLARRAAEVTAPGGLLFIASCSYNMTLPDFTAEVARGLSEVGREGRILATCFAAPDHPQHPALPESAYLKGLLLALNNAPVR